MQTESVRYRSRKLQVLVVEDDATIRRIMGLQLQQFGFKVDSAQDGIEAVRYSKDLLYDLIFMDIQMPIMNGLQATIAIRNHEERSGLTPVPIIATTAGGATRMQCIEAGMTEYMEKPVNSEKIKSLLESLFARQFDLMY